MSLLLPPLRPRRPAVPNRRSNSCSNSTPGHRGSVKRCRSISRTPVRQE
ncbi:hypothetical protein FM110_11485 [Brachybacterium nesterenkovii]|uniref:Uncharacterized protein n=1 Tax=Brachybacterium nesterenkovii TaxID=47847 RepID=A0A1X6X621_9MICO|nr:hypothetical protein FM110_11485 [Brachybacterium nesterenkovii]